MLIDGGAQVAACAGWRSEGWLSVPVPNGIYERRGDDVRLSGRSSRGRGRACPSRTRLIPGAKRLSWAFKPGSNLREGHRTAGRGFPVVRTTAAVWPEAAHRPGREDIAAVGPGRTADRSPVTPIDPAALADRPCHQHAPPAVTRSSGCAWTTSRAVLRRWASCRRSASGHVIWPDN